MPLYRPSELREFLASLGISPKKRLSQNFLIDGNVLKKIAALAELKAGDWVVEIGPGPGVLTELLLEHGCHVVAIEKDTVFANALMRLQKEEEGRNLLEVCASDIMGFSYEEYLQKRMPAGQKAKVVANIPYHLTSPIIEKILSAPSVIQSATLMVQEEVARRCVANPGSSDFSSFSVFLQFYSNVRYGFLVPPNCFYPPPKVESAVIRFDLQKKFSVSDEEGFFKMVRSSFMQRRKMVKSTLRVRYAPENIEMALLKLGKDQTVRPEELSCQDWVKLFELLNP